MSIGKMHGLLVGVVVLLLFTVKNAQLQEASETMEAETLFQTDAGRCGHWDCRVRLFQGIPVPLHCQQPALWLSTPCAMVKC